MTHSDDNILDLSPLSPNSGSGFEQSQFVNDDSITSGDDIDLLNQGILRQKIFIELNSDKARFAVRQQLNVELSSCVKYYEMANSVMRVNDEAKGKSCEPYTTAFNDRLLKLAARHTIIITEVNAAIVGREVMRKPKPSEPKNWFQRLLE
jgi:hypothetical protein